jgi:protein SCO1/2
VRAWPCKPKRVPPRRRQEPPKGLIAVLCGGAAVLLLAGCYLWFLGGTSASQTAAIGGPFELVGANGRTVTDRSFRGRYLLVYFGYTACRDVCPTTLSAVEQALDALGPGAARIQPLFITVDPARDTPDVLRAYLAAMTPRVIGLTGTPAQIRKVQQEYRVTSIVHPAGPGGTGYTVDHSSVLYLVGPDGQYLAPIRADESAADMAAAIAGHLS